MTIRSRAALSSALVAFLVAFPVCFFDPAWIPFSPGIPWDEIKDLPHHEAVDRIAVHQIDTRGLGSFASNLVDLRFWQYLGVLWAALATICFAACTLTQWQRKAP